SRRRHTRLQGDWSSDVCSSDLSPAPAAAASRRQHALLEMQDLPRLLGRVRVVCHHDDRLVEFVVQALQQPQDFLGGLLVELSRRSEERRVGKEWRSWGWELQ